MGAVVCVVVLLLLKVLLQVPNTVHRPVKAVVAGVLICQLSLVGGTGFKQDSPQQNFNDKTGIGSCSSFRPHQHPCVGTAAGITVMQYDVSIQREGGTSPQKLHHQHADSPLRCLVCTNGCS